MNQYYQYGQVKPGITEKKTIQKKQFKKMKLSKVIALKKNGMKDKGRNQFWLGRYQLLINLCKIQLYCLTSFLPLFRPQMISNVPNLKYKTTLCLNWSQGVLCEKGQGCYFAHGREELRSIQQNQEAISQRNLNYLGNGPIQNYKTIFCRFYAKGECKLGEACTFAHERREKKLKKSNTISYDSNPVYDTYAYYPNLQQWNEYGQQYYPTSMYQPYLNNVTYEYTSEQMKSSVETSGQDKALSQNFDPYMTSHQQLNQLPIEVEQKIEEEHMHTL